MERLCRILSQGEKYPHLPLNKTLSLQNGEWARFNAGDKIEGTAGPQWNFIVIWTKVMAVEWREKGNQEIFRKCNQMYLGIAWV